MRLDLVSERGFLREDIRPGLRVLGFERRLTVAFSVEAETVTIYRLFYGGQNWEEVLA
jgi:toxin ParE1/3/4